MILTAESPGNVSRSDCQGVSPDVTALRADSAEVRLG